MGMQYKYFEISGAGVLGALYIGAFQAIEELNGIGCIKNGLQGSVGVSAGSVISAMLAIGMSVDEMQSIYTNFDFTTIAPSFPNFQFSVDQAEALAINGRGHYGLNSGTNLRAWVDSVIANKTGKRESTFKDLKQFNQNFGLYIIGTDLVNSREIIFSCENTPDTVVANAIQISAAIPIFYDFVFQDDKVFVDGGVMQRIPIGYFMKEKKSVGPHESLCLGVVAKRASFPSIGMDQVSISVQKRSQDFFGKDISSVDGDPQPSFSWRDYLVALLECASVSQALYADSIAKLAGLDYLNITAPNGIKSTSFDLTVDQKKSLISEGHTQALKYFNR